MQSKTVFKICEGIWCSSFYVKEFGVIVHKNYFLVKPYWYFCHSVPPATSLANLVLEVGTRYSHQILLNGNQYRYGSVLQLPSYTVQCRYNAVQYNMIFHTPLHWLMQNINQTLNSQKILHISRPHGWAMECLLWGFGRKLTVFLWHCTVFPFYPRPVLAFGYCHGLRLCVCLSVCVCESVCQSLACPRDNLGPVQARITKFGPKV